jgi:phosphomannomutase
MEAEDYVVRAGRSAPMDIVPEYGARITGDCKLKRAMKIVVDSGNGIPGASAPAILRALGCEVTELYSKVDGDFPNHHPDPSKPENLADLIHTVQSTDAEIGLAFDGDGDRLGVVTKDGKIIYPDRQLMLFAKDILARNPGGTVIFDVKCTQRLAPVIRKAGGKPLMWKTGHSLVKAKMKQVKAPIAGEMSGHIFFGERWYGFDDAIYAAVRLIEAVHALGGSLTALKSGMPVLITTPELRFPTPESRKFAVIDEVLARLEAEGADVNRTDGARVTTPDGWWLLRASNTGAELVARAEAKDQAGLDQLLAQIDAQLAASGLEHGESVGH